MNTVITAVNVKKLLFVKDNNYNLASSKTYDLWIESMKNMADEYNNGNIDFEPKQEVHQVKIKVASGLAAMQAALDHDDDVVDTIVFVSTCGMVDAYNVKELFPNKKVFVATADGYMETDMFVEKGITIVSKRLLEEPVKAAEILFS